MTNPSNMSFFEEYMNPLWYIDMKMCIIKICIFLPITWFIIVYIHQYSEHKPLILQTSSQGTGNQSACLLTWTLWTLVTLNAKQLLYFSFLQVEQKKISIFFAKIHFLQPFFLSCLIYLWILKSLKTGDLMKN